MAAYIEKETGAANQVMGLIITALCVNASSAGAPARQRHSRPFL